LPPLVKPPDRMYIGVNSGVVEIAMFDVGAHKIGLGLQASLQTKT